MAEEEQRLDKMMEQQRVLGLKEEEKHKEKEALKNQRYLKALLHQIQENETERIHEAERKEEVGWFRLLFTCLKCLYFSKTSMHLFVGMSSDE